MTVYSKRGHLYLNFMLDGKRKQKALKMKDTSQNRKVVEKEIIPQLQKKIALGEYGQEKKEPKKFKYYADIFLTNKENSIKTFMNKLPTYNRVIKFFQNTYVKDITRLQIKQYLLSLDINNETRRDYLAVIKETLNYALDDGEVSQNNALDIDLPKERTLKKIQYFTKEEVQKLLSDKKDDELNLYLQIALNTGLRPEEVIALKRTDINNVFCKVQRVKTKGIFDVIMKTDSSRRTIPFSVDISSVDTNGSFYLFPNIDDVSSFRYRWKKLLKRCEIKHRGISNCRHTFATHLLRDGIVSINELSGLLGHAKVSTTLSYYASVIDSFDQTISNKLSNFGYHSVTQNSDNKNLSFA